MSFSSPHEWLFWDSFYCLLPLTKQQRKELACMVQIIHLFVASIKLVRCFVLFWGLSNETCFASVMCAWQQEEVMKKKPNYFCFWFLEIVLGGFPSLNQFEQAFFDKQVPNNTQKMYRDDEDFPEFEEEIRGCEWRSFDTIPLDYRKWTRREYDNPRLFLRLGKECPVFLHWFLFLLLLLHLLLLLLLLVLRTARRLPSKRSIVGAGGVLKPLEI